MTQAIPESTSKNTSKKEIPIVEIIDYLNHKTHSAYKPTTEKTKKVIRARVCESFTLAYFKKVIDLKTSEWLDDSYWSRYLRPETLFGTKFESYLNQKGFKKKITEEELLMAKLNGIDCVTKLYQELAEALKSSGVQYVGRFGEQLEMHEQNGGRGDY